MTTTCKIDPEMKYITSNSPLLQLPPIFHLASLHTATCTHALITPPPPTHPTSLSAPLWRGNFDDVTQVLRPFSFSFDIRKRQQHFMYVKWLTDSTSQHHASFVHSIIPVFVIHLTICLFFSPSLSAPQCVPCNWLSWFERYLVGESNSTINLSSND